MLFTLIYWIFWICVVIFLVQLIGFLALGLLIVALLETGHTYWAIAVAVVLVIIKAIDIYEDIK